NLAFDGVQFRRWASAWCDGVIEPQDFEQLKSTLAGSANARQMFITLMQVHARLQGQSMAQDYLASLVPLPPTIPLPFGDADAPESPIAKQPTILQFLGLNLGPRARRTLGGAAALLLVAAVWGLSRWMNPAATTNVENPSVAAGDHSSQPGNGPQST